MIRAIQLLGLFLLLLSVLAGCTTGLEFVEPWERGILASEIMRPDLNPMEERDWGEIYFSKEASSGGFGTGGGGCGCN